MTWNDISNIAGLFTDRPLAPELFADYATKANNELFAVKWVEKDFESLRLFKVVMGQDSQALVLVNGTGTLPTDYFHYESVYYMNGTTPVRVNIVDDKSFDILVSHAIEYPTTGYPIGSIMASTIRVRPVSVKFLVFTYISAPQPIVYAVTSTRGFPEFSEADSSEFKWNETDAVTLIQILLQNLNIQVSKPEIQNKIK